MLKRAKSVDQAKRKNTILVSVQSCDKSRIILAVGMHAKFIESSDDIQFNEMLAFDNLFNDLFYQKQRISISLCHNIKFSIIDAESQIFVNFHYE